jgi:hypothetical protein
MVLLINFFIDIFLFITVVLLIDFDVSFLDLDSK